MHNAKKLEVRHFKLQSVPDLAKFRSKSRVKIAVVFVVVIAAIFTVRALTPFFLGKYLKRAVAQACDGCYFQYAEFGWSSLKGFGLKEVSGKLKDGSGAEFVFKVPQMQFAFDWSSLAKGRLVTQPLAFKNVHFTITEFEKTGAQKKALEEARPPANASDKEWPIYIAELKFLDSTLHYVHKTQYGEALLRVNNVNAQLNGFTNSLEIYPKDWSLDVKGKLEKSADVHIEAKWQPALEKNRDEIKILVTDLNLKDLNGFFKPDNGMVLQGHAYRLFADMKISQGQLSGSLSGRYDGVKMDFVNDRRRSGLSAFVQTTIADLTFDDSNLHAQNRARQNVQFRIARRADDSIFSFLLSGLIPAVQKLL